MRSLLVIVAAIFLVVGCSDSSNSNDGEIESFDSSRMDALSIADEDYKSKFVKELDRQSIEFAEIRILDGSNYVITWKSDAQRVNEVYRDTIGAIPGKHSWSSPSRVALTKVIDLLEKEGIDYSVGQYYGDPYIEWDKSDELLVKSVIQRTLND